MANTKTLNAAQTQLAKDLAEAYKTTGALEYTKYQDVVNSFDEAYAVQALFSELKGEPVGGFKVSLTSERTQKLFGSDSPLFGSIVEKRWLQDDTTLELNSLNEPLVECELVFTATEELLPTDSLEDLARKTTVAAGLEVPDARFKEWFPVLPKYLVVSDGSVGGCVVFGKEHKTSELFPNLDDLAKVEMKLTFNDEEVATGVSSEVLGNPLNSLKWLVSKLHSLGLRFTPGLRVSSGTFNFPPHLKAGVWEVQYGSGVGGVKLIVK